MKTKSIQTIKFSLEFLCLMCDLISPGIFEMPKSPTAKQSTQPVQITNECFHCDHPITRKFKSLAALKRAAEPVQSCRVCGCTEDDCSGCIEKTSRPCYWVEKDLCSACVPSKRKAGAR
jgi:hypothetical protein